MTPRSRGAVGGSPSTRGPVRGERGLAEMRALAHPLRLRICQLFGERPRTTKQVAALLGEPPTKLYHHVHALERVGLLRLRETRPKRGTHEKYYELVRSAPVAGRWSSRGTPAPGADHRAAASALAASALDVARLESAAALARPEVWRAGRKPLVVRVTILSPAVAARIRRDLLAMIRRYAKTAHRIGAAARGEPWSLTLALLPTGARRPPRR